MQCGISVDAVRILCGCSADADADADDADADADADAGTDPPKQMWVCVVVAGSHGSPRWACHPSVAMRRVGAAWVCRRKLGLRPARVCLVR